MRSSSIPQEQTLAEAAWVHEAALQGITSPSDIIRWADSWITALDEPPYWLIELSTLKSPNTKDYAAIIEPELRQTLTISQKINLIASAVANDLLKLEEARGALFLDWVMAPRVGSRNFPEPIADLLVEWDSLDEMPADFETRFRAALENHLRIHGRGSEQPYLIVSSGSPC